MEMYNTADYLRVNPTYKVRAVEATAMYVNPDKEERRKEERKYSSSPPKKEKKPDDRKVEYKDVQGQEVEALRSKKAAGAEMENAPFRLWVYMTAKQGPRIFQREEYKGRDKQMEEYMSQQEKAAASSSQSNEEVSSFNAKA